MQATCRSVTYRRAPVPGSLNASQRPTRGHIFCDPSNSKAQMDENLSGQVAQPKSSITCSGEFKLVTILDWFTG